MAVSAAAIWTGCKKDSPVDEDGLLITTRRECYVAAFDMLGSDHLLVNKEGGVIDTPAQTIHIEVKYGTDLKKIWPRFSLAQDRRDLEHERQHHEPQREGERNLADQIAIEDSQHDATLEYTV